MLSSFSSAQLTCLCKSLSGDSDETQWAYVPVTDLILLVGEGLAGCAAEGFAVQADEGHTRCGSIDSETERSATGPKSIYIYIDMVQPKKSFRICF